MTVVQPATFVYSTILMEGMTEGNASYMLIEDGVSYFIREKTLEIYVSGFIALILRR